jgi:GTP cyclohydrolase II
MEQGLFASSPDLVIAASTPLPTRYGRFRVHVFRHRDESSVEHVAIVAGDVAAGEDVPLRIHSECLTSEVLGSLKCDCREQLEAALAHVGRTGRGAVFYLRQEGRGIGLTNKIRAYALQAQGVDTVDANRALGLPDDSRTYEQSAAMIRGLGIRSVRLMTNNPAKLTALRALGVDVRARIPVVVAPNAHSLAYLETKRDRMDHALPTRLAAAGGDAE